MQGYDLCKWKIIQWKPYISLSFLSESVLQTIAIETESKLRMCIFWENKVSVFIDVKVYGV